MNGLNLSSEQYSTTSSKVTSKPGTLTLLTEGGKVVTDVPSLLSLTNEKTTVLLALDKELGNTNEKKPVHSRKGAPNSTEVLSVPNSEEVELSSKVSTLIKSNKNVTKLLPVDNLHNKTITLLSQPGKNVSTSTAQPILVAKTTADANITLMNINKATMRTEHVKKPRILVYDDLASDKVNESPSLPELKSSSKPTLDQIPSPNSKLHLKSKGADPGMIIPIVITILVVPAFAVLAYMAVKRGREAWKNRHYKRMDFLLDGMYND